ncbi:MAG: MarR family winged helix-turn-helix transcriptional regulator, partial [Eubacteriales bacterium]
MEREKLTRYLNRLEEVFQHMIRRLHAELAQSMVKGVTGSQFFVLKKIGDRGKLTVSEVAEDTGVSLSAITVLVDRLFKAGLVNRTRDDRDRRLVWLELTDEG